MNLVLWTTMLLQGLAAEKTEPYEFASVHDGQVTLTLAGVIKSAKGPARYTLILTVYGPISLQVEPPQLEEAAAAWRLRRQFGTWSQSGDRAIWSQTLDLEKGKAGSFAFLPDVRVRFREGPAGEWKVAVWKDLLKEPRGELGVEELPPPPKSPWPKWLALGVLALGIGGSLTGAIWLWRRPNRRAGENVPSFAAELAELSTLAPHILPTETADYHARLAGFLRDYLTWRYGVESDRRTSAEVIEIIQKKEILPPERISELADFFRRCDWAKFAGVACTPDDCRIALSLAHQLMEQTNSAGQYRPVAEAGKAR
jgi:hypothetical protein